MKRIDLEVREREAVQGEQSMNGFRKSGWVPGVLYANGQPEKVAVELKSLLKALHNPAGVNALFNLVKDGDRTLSIIKEIQRDILSAKPIHVDFIRVNVKEKLEITVPIRTVGEAPGVKNSGGILEHIQRDLKIRCLPDDIPAHVDVDVSGLEVHQGIKVADIVPPKGVEILTAGDHIVVNVVTPKVEEEPAAPAAGEAAEGAEPEVIAKGKKPEEGEEAAAPAAAAKGKEEKQK